MVIFSKTLTETVAIENPKHGIGQRKILNIIGVLYIVRKVL